LSEHNSGMSSATPIGALPGADTPAPALVYPASLSPDDVEAYHALRRDAVWFDGELHWSSIEGPKAIDALNGLVTNDVSQLAVGMGQHAVALTPKGKVVCDMTVVRISDERLMLAMLPHCLPAWLDLARKYINPRLAKVADERERWVTWMLYGTNASLVITDLGATSGVAESGADSAGSELAEWPAWSHGVADIASARVRLIRAPLLGTLPGFVIVAEAGEADAVRTRLEAFARPRGSQAVWELARVEAGRPEFGVDMDENTIPQEANLDTLGAISFTKGCYTGQETVARVHFRGHVNRHLRGLTAAAPLPRSARVIDATGKDVGDVRSSALSPRLGPIAMAMVRREVAPGATVTVEGEEATVVELPFPG
jgi:folate-binding protein YgfZ